jgi:hypothetical protein
MENKERVEIGVDPGSASGNVCLLKDDGGYLVLPFAEHTLRELYQRLWEWNEVYDCEAVSEVVHGFPGMSTVAVSSLMKNMGHIEMGFAAAEISTRYVSPQAWMKFYGVKKDKGETKTVWKKRLREVLQQRLPEVKCTTEQADAVLIALYGRCTRV